MSNLNSCNNWNRTEDSGEMRLGYSSPSLQYSNEPRTVPELLQNKAIIRTNALEILCILEDDEGMFIGRGYEFVVVSTGIVFPR